MEENKFRWEITQWSRSNLANFQLFENKYKINNSDRKR